MASAVVTSVVLDAPKEVVRFRADQYRVFSSLAEAFYWNANLNGDLIAYEQADGDCDRDSVPREYLPTYQRETKQRVLKLAAQFEAWGIQPGDAIAILSLNRPEWTEAEMAAYTVGAVAVAMYVRVTEERLKFMLRDAAPKCVVVENQQLFEAVLVAEKALDDGQSRHDDGIRAIVAIEDIERSPAVEAGPLRVKSMSEIFAEVPDRSETSFAWVHSGRNDLASVYYTSGSSGSPTGVPVTHGQVLENLHQIVAARLIDYRIYEGPDAPTSQPCVTLILPERAHAFPARTTQLVATSPARARYSTVIDHHTAQVSDSYRDSIRRDLHDGAAGIVPIVPKVLITIQQRVRQRLSNGGPAERFANLVVENATRRTLEQHRGKTLWSTEVVYRLLSRVRQRITKKIRERIVGPEFEFFISGGAKLPLETAAYLWALGMPVYEGYGSTESNCPVATNTPENHRLGSVGQVFAGVEMRIDPASRELWLRGPNVADHYWHQPANEASNWTRDGWYRTRDVARQDADGYLYIEDRIDNILVLQNGENISATAVEQRFAAIPYIDSVVVLGHQRPVLVALVTLCEEPIRQWAKEHGRQLGTNLLEDSVVHGLIRSEVEHFVNERSGQACERIRHVGFIGSLAIENQTLTATEKVRRKEIERRYATLIDDLYADSADWLPAFDDCRQRDSKTVANPSGTETGFVASQE